MPSADTLKALAVAYDYPYEKLMSAAGYLDDGTTMESSVINEDVVKIPICLDIRNGRGIIVDYGYLPKRLVGDNHYIFLKIKDDSMLNSRMGKDDLALVRRQPHVEDDTIGVIEILDNGTVIRKIQYDGDDVILTPTNDLYAHKRHHKSEISFIGVVELVIVYIG
jgi:SOS-response transcriptional repressor LexA